MASPSHPAQQGTTQRTPEGIDPKAFTDAENPLQSSCYCIIRLRGTVMLMRTATGHGIFQNSSNLSITKTQKRNVAMQLRPKDIQSSVDIRQDTSAWLSHDSS